MWIKVSESYYVCTDQMVRIYYDSDKNMTIGETDKYNRLVICVGNHVEEIIRNIISGTKRMEVQ